MIVKFYHKGEFILEKEIDLDIFKGFNTQRLIDAFKYHFNLNFDKYNTMEFELKYNEIAIMLRDEDIRDFKLNIILNI